MTIQEAVKAWKEGSYIRPVDWSGSGRGLIIHGGYLMLGFSRPWSVEVNALLGEWEVVPGATIDEERAKQQEEIERICRLPITT